MYIIKADQREADMFSCPPAVALLVNYYYERMKTLQSNNTLNSHNTLVKILFRSDGG